MNTLLERLTTAGISAALIGSSLATGVRAEEIRVALDSAPQAFMHDYICSDASVVEASKTPDFSVIATLSAISRVSDNDTSFRALIESAAKSRLDALEEIKEFKDYVQGWDGDNADEIAMSAIELATRFLNSYDGPQVFSVYPDPDGSVGLQSELQNGRVLLSFGKDEKIAYFIRKNSAVHRGSGVTQGDVERVLKSFA